MNARITVLYDEGALPATNYIGAQGASFIIDVDGERTLFGAGHRYRYLENNMGVMGIKADSVTRVVIPDKNPDEWGGIDAVLKSRTTPVKVSAPASVWGQKTFLGSTGMFFSPTYAGMGERDDLVPGWSQISEHLFVGVFGNDMFQEAVLVIRAATGPVVVSCRCLSGMKSVFEAVEDRFKRMPVAYIGGLEIGKKNDQLCDAVAAYVSSTGCTDLHFNGCTHAVGIGRLRKSLGLDGVKDFFVGESLEYTV